MTPHPVPLIEVITRTVPGREAMLARQRASLEAFPQAAWRQTLLYDPARRGVNASYVRMRTVEPSAEWAWILDDDDLLADAKFLEDLDGEADMHVYQMRFMHNAALMPPAKYMNLQKITRRRIGAPCVVVRRALWMASRHAFTNRYEGELEFIREAAARAQRVEWHQRVIADIDGPHAGRWPIESAPPESEAVA